MRSKLITLIICLFSFAIVPVQAGSVTVTSSADSGPGSLREVLAAAIDGTTIQFAPALNGQTITLTSGELLIGANVTISGPPTSPIIVKRSTDTGTSAFRIFHITPGHTVTLSWLIITNGLAQGSPPDQSGGGIYNDGSIVTIENCQVDVNSAGNGGGIFSTAVNSGAAQLTINASNVDGNMATGDGGAIYNDGSGESHAASLVLIQSTTLTNTAQNGAGILNNGSSSGNADLVINDSLIAFNNATHQGGGILNFGQQNSGNTRATVSNSTLSQNRAENGGAILNDGQSGNARLDIATSTIAKNFVTQQGGSVYNTIGTNPLRSKGARKPDGSGPIAILTIKNTILDSIVNGAAENVFNDQGQVTSSGYNIISDDGGGFFSAPGDQTYTDPKLGLLQNNGGGIQTHALPGNSAAVNGGDPAFTPPPFYDQRGTGFDRVFGGRIDIGAFELQETAPPPARGTLINISTRLRILTADKSLIGGFIVAGTAPRRVLLRAIGPSLAGIIPDAIVDPVLELHGPAGFETIINDNWRDTQEAKIIATGIPPTNNFESAILATLPPGAYTAVMHGLDDGIGVGVVEAYDLDSTNDARLANISTRGFVDTGNNVMIGGFILGHGNLNAQILIRAIGPSLGKFGVPDVLADPTLELFNSNGFPVATNDNWRDTQEAEIEATGIPPTNDLESAIVRSLTPDAYTAIVRGVNESVGVGLVEVYQLVPPPTPTPTATPELTPSPTPEPSPTPKETPTPTPTPTETPTPVPTETPSPTPDKSPVAFSVYSSSARVGTGDAISMNAALVTGPGARRIIVRGLGPSLPTPAPLADPALELRGNSILIRANDNWRSDQEAEITDTGFAPTNDLEAAMVETIPAGSYTVVLRGVINGTGFGANDLHDLSGSDPGSISAIGTRAQVLTGNEILASGIQVENGGDMLIRALGPSLSSAGIATVLADPTIQLRDSNGDPVVDNDNWRDDPKQEALIIATGLAPSDNLESAIFVSLLPGTYTTVVQGNAGGTGIGYVQFYSLPHTGAVLPLVP